ncbi:hypothetical protein ABK249_31625, partial [Neorhizobium sp. Rsf11]
CLDRRIDNRDLLKSEVDAWERRRTESGAQIRWMFSTDQAREKDGKVLSNTFAQRVIISGTSH